MSDLLGRLAFRKVDACAEQLIVGPDGGTRQLLAEFAQEDRFTIEEAAANSIRCRASEYQKDREMEQLWSTLTDREQAVVALCCLEYSDREVAGVLDIAYATPRTHLYNAIYKLGINKKSELPFVLRNWDFSTYDRDYARGT